MSFVFKYFLASFPLFFIFCGSRLSPLAGARRFWFAPGGRGGRGWRRIVPDLTTKVGYHVSALLSSENCNSENGNSENGCGPNLGGNAGSQPTVAPARWGRSEPDGTGRRYAQIRTALGEASPYVACRYRWIRGHWATCPNGGSNPA